MKCIALLEWRAMSLKFEVAAVSEQGGRRAELTLPHGVVQTPVFMPVGTAATVKAVPQETLETLGPRVQGSGSSEGAGKIVMVIASDGTAKKRTVTVGIQTTESTQILTGLKPEDMVITGGGYGLDDGTKVKVGPAEAKDADDAKPEAGAASQKAGEKE